MTRAMKDSGIEWIGQIPENWEVSKLKSHFSFEKGKNAAQYTQEYIGENEGCYPVYSGQTENNGIMGKINSFDYDIKECVFSTTVGAKVMTPRYLRGKFSLSQNCLIMLPMSKYVCKLLYYVLLPLFSYEKALIPSHMQPSLRFSDLKKYFLPLPPLSEQQKIADYLDKRCEKIDTAIDNQKQIIEKLKEYKQSLITETVTKGLNPNVKLKDSGIEWIGSIPEHWEIRKLSRLFKERKCKNTGMKEHNVLSLSYGKIKKRDIENNMGLLPESFETYNIVIPGNIVLRLTDLQNDHRSLRTGLVKEVGIITSAYVTMERIMDIDEDYYHKLLHTFDIMKGFYNMGDGVRQSLKFNELNKLLLPQPPLSEQKEIAEYLDKKCNQIDEAIKQKEETISKLEEYKKSLIFECVTGKKEVA